MESYSEPEKKKVRIESLSFAIDSLTKNRTFSTLTRRNYPREIYNFLKKRNASLDREILMNFSKKDLETWELFYDSIIISKRKSDLKIAYLAGPNPTNDLQVLLKKGILPQNIWAFEEEAVSYSSGISSLLDSEYPLIKLYKGKIEKLLSELSVKFDIIYLDFCGTIASKSTLSVLRQIFSMNKLNSPGIVITNFSLPNNSGDSAVAFDNLIRTSSNYLWSKPFIENPYTRGGGSYYSGASELDLDYAKFTKRISLKNPENIYSQFITRLLFDIPSVIIPSQKFANNQTLINLFFKSFETSSFPEYFKEDLFICPDNHSISNGFYHYEEESQGVKSMQKEIIRQLNLFEGKKNKGFDESILLMDFFSGEIDNDVFHSEKLKQIGANWDGLKKYIFCDVFMFHQLKDILIGQYTNPYYYNPEYTKRWSYKAKTNRMFVDLITYDECRYIFDWMPTIDMFAKDINKIEKELTLRFAMDGINKARRWYNDEFFSGTAVIGNHLPGFEPKELSKRKFIN